MGSHRSGECASWVKNKMRKATLIIISVILIIIMSYLFYDGSQDNGVTYNVKEIHSQNFNSSLFIKQKLWGLTSDNQIIIISTSPTKKFSPNPTTDYIYEGLSPFYYKFHGDTLFVYTMQNSKIPKSFKTKIIIVQTELANPEMMRLVKNYQYKKEGLN